jgi:hypothetical protein
MNRCSTVGFKGNETFQCDITAVDICHLYLSKHMDNIKSESEPKCEQWTLGDIDMSI